ALDLRSGPAPVARMLSLLRASRRSPLPRACMPERPTRWGLEAAAPLVVEWPPTLKQQHVIGALVRARIWTGLQAQRPAKLMDPRFLVLFNPILKFFAYLPQLARSG